MYLTDNLENPTKHKIDDSGTPDLELGTKQFKRFWADNNVDLGIDHVGFKLKAKKEEIGIFSVLGPDTLMIDSLLFSDQITNKSYGRYPDGSGNLVTLNTLTPGESNVILSINDTWDSFTATLFPNPIDEILFLKLTGTMVEEARLQLLNIKGQIVHDMLLPNPGTETHEIRLSHLPQGVYIARIQTSSSLVSSRIIKK